MPILAGRKRRERTNASSHTASIVYNSPGTYQPKYGKIKVYVSGHGAPGNAGSPSTVANYNPAVPGNYAGTNPSTPGNIVYNPDVPGTIAYNPPSGGNVAGYNPPVTVIQYAYAVVNYSRGDPTTYDQYHYVAPTTMQPYTVYQQHNTNYINPAGGYEYMVWTLSESPVPGNANYNPVTPGSAYYNPVTKGTVAYNPPTPGSAYYNPPTYVSEQYTPGYTIPGNYVPGNTNAPVEVPGNYVPAQYSAGNTQPGNYNPGTYTPGNTNPTTYNPGAYTPGNFVSDTYYEQPMGPIGYGNIPAGGNMTCPPGWETYYDSYDQGTQYVMICSLYYPAYTNPGTYTPGNPIPGNTNQGTYTDGNRNPDTTNPATYTAAYTNPSTYTQGYTNNGYYNTVYVAPSYVPASYSNGNLAYNPPVPGNVVYNTSTPGNAYYNPATPGNANYNPAVAGNPGTPFTSMGVYFPGGGPGAPAGAISDTVVTIPYSANPIAVPVAPGAQVIIKEGW